MKAFLQIAPIVIGMILTIARADNEPQKVSVAPKNDLSAIVYTGPRGVWFGSSVCGYNLSKEFEEGYKIGTKNDHFGTRNILMIDDGKSTFPATDKTTGFPIIVLTDAKVTKEFLDLVRGYNKSMQSAFEQRKKKTEQAAPSNR
jgi:hypothetical protein